MVLIFSCLIFLSGCTSFFTDLFCIQGSGNIISENREVNNFKSIKIKGQGNVYLTQSDTVSLKVESDDNILGELKTQVIGSTLEIGPSAGVRCLSPTEEINIWVSIVDINDLDVSGSGNIYGQTKLQSNDLNINISGSGKLELDLDVTSLDIDISGSGNAILKGTADSHQYNISGSGKLYAYDLITKSSEVTISGSGMTELTATEVRQLAWLRRTSRRGI